MILAGQVESGTLGTSVEQMFRPCKVREEAYRTMPVTQGTLSVDSLHALAFAGTRVRGYSRSLFLSKWPKRQKLQCETCWRLVAATHENRFRADQIGAHWRISGVSTSLAGSAEHPAPEPVFGARRCGTSRPRAPVCLLQLIDDASITIACHRCFLFSFYTLFPSSSHSLLIFNSRLFGRCGPRQLKAP
jgi:hypothetical protein